MLSHTNPGALTAIHIEDFQSPGERAGADRLFGTDTPTGLGDVQRFDASLEFET